MMNFFEFDIMNLGGYIGYIGPVWAQIKLSQ